MGDKIKLSRQFDPSTLIDILNIQLMEIIIIMSFRNYYRTNRDKESVFSSTSKTENTRVLKKISVEGIFVTKLRCLYDVKALVELKTNASRTIVS